MNIHQLNVSHNDRQDRLLLRLNTQSGEEFRFWLTRRLTLRLLPVLQQTVGRLESNQPQMLAPDPASKQILTELKRDAFLQKADFKTPYVEKAQQLPLGEEPMLVTDVQMQVQGTEVLLTLQDKGSATSGTPAQVQSCQLNLQPSLVHGLIHLIQQAMARAEWQLTLVATAATAEEAPAAMPTASGYRH